jgi:Xaa-Pro aminopeptidase
VNDRAERLAQRLGEHELDLLIVSQPVNVRYLCGYTGSNGLALIGSSQEQPNRFYTDFRYATQSAEQVPANFQREIVSGGELLSSAAGTLSAAPGAMRVGFEEDHLTVSAHARLRGCLAEVHELVGVSGVVGEMRAVKDEGEIARIRASAKLTDEILRWISETGLTGRSERQVAIALEHEMRLRGAQAPSFPSIVACAEHGALPHAEPRDVQIPAGVLVTIDLGAILDGYCSDCTRTFATGPIPQEQRDVYALVAQAQMAGLQAARPGLSGREVDAAARAVIEQAGHGEHFGHGLGHGVGMEIHEAPRLSQSASERPLQAGNVLTVEPGVYVPGRFGVRIEDLVLLTEDGCETLSEFPKDLIELS